MTSAHGLPPAPEPLPPPVTDAHTHLASTERLSGLAPSEALAKARTAGVTRVVEVGTDVASSTESIALAEHHDEVLASIAIHPNDAARLGERLDVELARLEALISTSPRVRGIGETGLDYFRTRDAADQARQRYAFAAHIAWATAYDLTLVIHRGNGKVDRVALTCRVDTLNEVDYYRHGGILPYVLRGMAEAKAA